MQVIAKKAGFYGGSLRPEGATFDVPEGAKASWFEPAEEEKSDAKADPKTTGKAKADPKTLSELGKQPAKGATEAQG